MDLFQPSGSRGKLDTYMNRVAAPPPLDILLGFLRNQVVARVVATMATVCYLSRTFRRILSVFGMFNLVDSGKDKIQCCVSGDKTLRGKLMIGAIQPPFPPHGSSPSRGKPFMAILRDDLVHTCCICI